MEIQLTGLSGENGRDEKVDGPKDRYWTAIFENCPCLGPYTFNLTRNGIT